MKVGYVALATMILHYIRLRQPYVITITTPHHQQYIIISLKLLIIKKYNNNKKFKLNNILSSSSSCPPHAKSERLDKQSHQRTAHPTYSLVLKYVHSIGTHHVVQL